MARTDGILHTKKSRKERDNGLQPRILSSHLSWTKEKLRVKGNSHLPYFPLLLSVKPFHFRKAEPHLNFKNHYFYLLVISFTFNTNPASQIPIKIHFANINPRVNPDKEKQIRDVFVFNYSRLRKLELYWKNERKDIKPSHCILRNT